MLTKGDLVREAAWAVVVNGMGGATGARPSPPTRKGLASESWARPRLPALREEWRRMSQEARDTWEAVVVALACGPLAQARVTGASLGRACAADLAFACEALLGAEVADKAAVGLLADWVRQAQAVLENPATWSAVERVAAELEQRGSLSAAEVRALLVPAGCAEPAGCC
jgi:hypothetical protein